MLNKLLKHELRGTGRILLPTLGAILILGVMAGISYRVMNSRLELFWALKAVLGLLQGVFFASLFAACVLVAVTVIQRFYRNLMGDEGYISFTLPVTADGHLWSKLIASLVWMAAVTVFSALAMSLFFAIGDGRIPFAGLDVIGFLQKCNETMGVGNTTGFLLEVLLGLALCCFVQCLHFYAAIALGCSFARNKKLLSVVFYFVLSMVRNALALSAVPVVASRSVLQWMKLHASFGTFEEALPALHIVGSGACLVLILAGAVYYLIARYCMTKRLNLA